MRKWLESESKLGRAIWFPKKMPDKLLKLIIFSSRIENISEIFIPFFAWHPRNLAQISHGLRLLSFRDKPFCAPGQLPTRKRILCLGHFLPIFAFNEENKKGIKFAWKDFFYPPQQTVSPLIFLSCLYKHNKSVFLWSFWYFRCCKVSF